MSEDYEHALYERYLLFCGTSFCQNYRL